MPINTDADRKSKTKTMGKPTYAYYDYRVVFKDGKFSVHQLYYDTDHNPVLMSPTPVYPHGASFAEMARDLRNYYAALQKPVMNYTAKIEDDAKKPKPKDTKESKDKADEPGK